MQIYLKCERCNTFLKPEEIIKKDTKLQVEERTRYGCVVPIKYIKVVCPVCKSDNRIYEEWPWSLESLDKK